MLFQSARDMIGHTPLVRLALDVPDGTEVYAKLELANPFAMKDRVAKSMVEEALRTGALQPGAPIVESSSGTLALGVALVGRTLGHPVHIVTDPRIDPITLAKLRALDAHVHMVASMTGQGWQSARLERLSELLRDLPGAFWPRQYTNPDNPRAYRALVRELIDDLATVDILVGAVGSGGSLCGSTRELRKTFPSLRSVGVDCVGSALFEQPDFPRRLQSGLGNSLSPNNLDRDVIDEVHWLNDHEAFAATRALVREQGIFAGNTSGSVYRVLTEIATRATPGSRIVGIFPDRGDRYVDTVYSDEYWAEQRVRDLPLATEPGLVAYGTTVTQWSRAALPRADKGGKYLIFVESNTSGTGMDALRTARELGLRPVLITGRPERYAGLDETGSEIVVCDTNSPAELRTVIQERFPRQSIAGLTTTSDFYVPVTAELTEWLDLPGNSADAVAACRNKDVTRGVLWAAGIGQPDYAVVTDVDEVAKAVAETGLPCVVKPSDDSGSNNVKLCADVDEAREMVSRILAVRTNVRGQAAARTVLVEEFVQGDEYSVETFTHDGVTTCIGVTAKSVTAGPHFVETGHVFPAPLPTGAAAELAETVIAALDAVGWRSGPAHTEVKLTASGPRILEINPRLAGGMIPELIRQAIGADLLEQQLRAATGLPVDLTATREGYAAIRFLLSDRAGVLSGVEGVEEASATPGVTKVAVSARSGTAVEPAENAYGRIGHLIAAGDTAAMVTRTLDAAHDRMRICVDTKPPHDGSCGDRPAR
ncbi:pyridoxal-phosphate dependent enzyme [Streptomyces xanthochromogenes]|uniref:pyridoxal-phosphate dependent enzyme n=1 Tax=Streptomyces xanthochromogenes TaxID=67384 RepID=UPI002F409198